RAPKKKEPTLAERRSKGFGRAYYAVVGWAVDHRWIVLGGAMVLFFGGVAAVRNIKQAFFPKDLSYLSYVDVWLPEDSPIGASRGAAATADRVIREAAAKFGAEHPGSDGKPRDVLRSITTFVGGGGPRFWFSVTPEQRQANYAQLVIQVND